eukprot:EC813511.1.p6 GENE.EC813511.1~~EC813511.1.p6  ORF type:complete len:56 (-),score=11.46 EC813511.1:205-372(-)
MAHVRAVYDALVKFHPADGSDVNGPAEAQALFPPTQGMYPPVTRRMLRDIVHPTH